MKRLAVVAVLVAALAGGNVSAASADARHVCAGTFSQPHKPKHGAPILVDCVRVVLVGGDHASSD